VTSKLQTTDSVLEQSFLLFPVDLIENNKAVISKRDILPEIYKTTRLYQDQTYCFFILSVQLIIFFTPTICQTRCFIGAEKGPFPVALNSFHKEIRHPKGVK